MRILQQHEVPTGHILVVRGEHGDLECLSLGDYGKDANIKCDAMGLARPLASVPHQEMLPLEKKWVITISSQYGCSMGCSFCDVPKVGPGLDATFGDLLEQIGAARNLHPEVKSGERMNIHFARMGEPTFNPDVLTATRYLGALYPTFRVHPVVSTMMPKRNKWLREFLRAWIEIKNHDSLLDDAGLQLSINSTCEEERRKMFNGNALRLSEISRMMKGLAPPARGRRKYTLNFAVTGEYTVDAQLLANYFDPLHFLVKLTPMHLTASAVNNNLYTPGDTTTSAPYEKLEAELKEAGFDVLVFVASEEEDSSRITCGNAILSGTVPEG
jgi:23S rRNA (adenine2503-C2)-methyltransferase